MVTLAPMEARESGVLGELGASVIMNIEPQLHQKNLKAVNKMCKSGTWHHDAKAKEISFHQLKHSESVAVFQL